jgi:hypothetical protein
MLQGDSPFGGDKMSGNKLVQRVEDAEQATGGVIRDQRRRVDGAVPVRVQPEAQRLESSTGAALESTDRLITYGQMVRAALRSRRTRSGAQPNRSAEDMYLEAERGIERPPVVYANSAEAHDRNMRIQAQIDGSQRGAGGEGAGASLLEQPGRAEEQMRLDGMSLAVSSEWMTRDFLGDAVFARFTSTPPVAAAETIGWLNGNSGLPGSGVTGMQEPGTNMIVVAPMANEADYYRIIAHEQLHYASYLGGGAFRWRDDNGEAVYRANRWNATEGLTELFAQRLTRDNGYVPTVVAYTFETAASFALEQVVGSDVLRRAYMGGDFNEVRRLADERLGAGAFDGFMACTSGAEAFSYIMEKASAAGINYRAWESDPIMGRIYSQVSIERFR